MKLSWTSKEQSIASFYTMLNPISDNRIDCDPVGQRPDIESMSKRQGIIDTIFRGYDFGELKLRTLLDGHYRYRSIDGGHRKRSIRDYINNRFKTGKQTVCYVNGVEYEIGGKYFKELPTDVKEQFLAYKMRFTIYGEEMTDEQAGETFRRTNISTDVNWQEMLNSYEDNLVAKFVREISRPIRDLKNEYHTLFEYTDLNPENRKQAWFKKASTRLRDDEFVTRFLTILTKTEKSLNWMTCSNRENEKTFIRLGNPFKGEWKNPQLAKRHQKIVIDALDFMLNYARSKKRNSRQLMSVQEFTMVSRLYVYFVKTFGKNGFKVRDFDDLYNSVRFAMDKFVGKNGKTLRMDTHKDNKGVRFVSECFRQYLTVHDDETRSEQSVKWLLEEMSIDECGIIFLDSIRVFPNEMVEQVLRQQNYKCWVTGMTLNIKDAVGGHIVPHSEGGMTRIYNCMVCHKDENRKMGSMDAHLYRQARLQELGEHMGKAA
jgi:hypothetical protein